MCWIEYLLPLKIKRTKFKDITLIVRPKDLEGTTMRLNRYTKKYRNNSKLLIKLKNYIYSPISSTKSRWKKAFKFNSTYYYKHFISFLLKRRNMKWQEF
jgi:hypothetical protein